MRASEALDAAYGAIKHSILSGEFEPGQPLVEAVLAAKCQVSRTPVREALSRLMQDGLVQRTARGLVVRDRSPDEVLDLYDSRILLEGSVARYAAERRTRMDLVRLRAALSRAEAIKKPSPQDMVETNTEFHQAVWHAAHNESLSDLLERLSLHVARYTFTTLTYRGRWAQAMVQHRQITEAIDAQDQAKAGTLAEQHFTEARDIRVALWTGEPVRTS